MQCHDFHMNCKKRIVVFCNLVYNIQPMFQISVKKVPDVARKL